MKCILHTLGYSKGLNKSGIVFCEPCGVRPVDEQSPAPPWFLSTLELHGLFFFQHHSVIEVLTPVLHYGSWTFIRHGLSDWQNSAGMICGDLGHASQIQGPFMIRFYLFHNSRKKQTSLNKQPHRYKLGYLHSAPASRPLCLCPHLISPYQAKVAPVLTLWARSPALPLARSSPPLFAVLYWCGGIDQLICWLCGQGLSVLMPAWQMCSLQTTAVTLLPFENVANKRDCIPEFIPDWQHKRSKMLQHCLKCKTIFVNFPQAVYKRRQKQLVRGCWWQDSAGIQILLFCHICILVQETNWQKM